MRTFAIPAGRYEEIDRARALDESMGESGSGAPDRQAADRHTRWRTIEVRHLAALAAVAQEGSFRRAADRLGYVQSAISSQIAHLERAAGTRLIERSSGSSRVRITTAGRVLLGHTDEIIARLDAAYSEVSSLASRDASTVRVAGLEHFAPRRFARVLRWFRERHPLARVTLEDAGSDEMNFERLRSGAIDLVVGELPPIEAPFSHLELEQDPYVLLVATGSPLADCRKPSSAAEIASLRLIVPVPSGPSSRGDMRLRELGVVPRSSFRPESVATAQALVEAGLGEAIVPRSQLDLRDARTVAIELPKLLPVRTIAFVFHAERECSPAVQGFMRLVTVACGAERRSRDALAA